MSDLEIKKNIYFYSVCNWLPETTNTETNPYCAGGEAAVWRKIAGCPRGSLQLCWQHPLIRRFGPARSVAYSQIHSDETGAPPPATTQHLRDNTTMRRSQKWSHRCASLSCCLTVGEVVSQLLFNNPPVGVALTPRSSAVDQLRRWTQPHHGAFRLCRIKTLTCLLAHSAWAHFLLQRL